MTYPKEFRDANIKTPEAVQKLKDLAQRFYDDPEGTAHQIGKELQHVLNTAGDNLEHARDTVRARINDRPVESSLLALAVGVVAGLIVGRR